MSVLSAQTIRRIVRFSGSVANGDSRIQHIVEPFCERTQHEESGTSFGLSACGYDIRLDQDIVLGPAGHADCFDLASTMEEFCMPDWVVGIVHDKSTWARRGMSVQNTVIEPGWCGFLTLELNNNGRETLRLLRGTPVAQVLFHGLDAPTVQPYTGKYQSQERGPQEAR